MKRKWLDIPLMSQHNPTGVGGDWCGRTSGSMIYNYYKKVAGHGSEHFISQNATLRNLTYPDNTIAAMNGSKYYTREPLDRAVSGWEARQLFPKEERPSLPLSKVQIATILGPVIEAINKNNPGLLYTGITNNPANSPMHIVVASGYRIEENGDIWLHIDDPATMNSKPDGSGKVDLLGPENLEVLEAGDWNESKGCRYWLKASRLFEHNQRSTAITDDLWCDQRDSPGLYSILNRTANTPGTYAHVQETDSVGFPLLISCVGELVPNFDRLTRYFDHVEKSWSGGYFPIGVNTNWHSGVHLVGAEGATVHAMADGMLVCARMPCKDKEQENLKYGSRNFVLIRHGKYNKEWYSLYCHLKSVELDSEEAMKIAWLTKDRLVVFNKTAVVREQPIVDDVLGPPITPALQQNASVEIIEKTLGLDKPEDTWYKIQHKGKEGFVKFRSDAMKVVTGSSTVLNSDEGQKVIKLELPVRAGDVIGIVGDSLTQSGGEGETKTILHWSVFTPGKPATGKGWEETEEDGGAVLISGTTSNQNGTAEQGGDIIAGTASADTSASGSQNVDQSNDFLCDDKKIINLIEEAAPDAALPPALKIVNFFKDETRAKKMRTLACKFRSEWSINWEGDDQSKAFEKLGIVANTKTLLLYNWWEEAAKIDKNLPADGKVWHYNPITLIRRTAFTGARAKFTDDMFEPGKSFFVFSKLMPLLAGITQFQLTKPVSQIVLLGHRRKNEPEDAVSLTQKRLEAISALLSGDANKLATVTSAWNTREQRTLLAFLRTSNGTPFYTKNIEEEDPEALKESVIAFQTAKSVNPAQGLFGPKTYNKVFSDIRAKANFYTLSVVTELMANEPHIEEEQGVSTCVLEAYFWSSDVVPPVSEYAQSASGTYKDWVLACESIIEPVKPLPEVLIETGKGVLHEIKKKALSELEEWGFVPVQ